MSRKTPSDGFSREESRYLDGEMPADDARRLEHHLAADPVRADRVEAYREAMDVWREDAARVAGNLNADKDLADRILASVADGPPRLALSRSRAAPWYSAAALLLIGIGVGGTLLSRPAAEAVTAKEANASLDDLAEFENAMVDLLIDSPEFSPRLASSGPK